MSFTKEGSEALKHDEVETSMIQSRKCAKCHHSAASSAIRVTVQFMEAKERKSEAGIGGCQFFSLWMSHSRILLD